MSERIRPEEAAHIFQTTKQEKLRLEAALRGYFAPFAPEEDGQRAAYRAYIKKRIRSAARLLLVEGEAPAVLALLREGLMSEALRRELLLESAREGQTGAWLCLMAGAAGTVGESDDPAAALRSARRQICTLFPFLDCAAAALPFRQDARTRTMGSDGEAICYEPGFVLKLAREDGPGLTRLYLHCLLHCILRHWERPEREAADREVEALIEAECVRRALCRRWLGDADPSPPDDHSLWPASDPEDGDGRLERVRRRWELLGSVGAGNGGGEGLAGSLGIGTLAGGQTERITELRRGTGDYRSFLSRFAVMREEAELDTESFDYIYYSLGMERFGNLPLVEPLEYKEGHKLSELVIAIDTSGSCSVALVRRFLEETYAILGAKENFFKRMKVYFIQCDCTIHDVRLIESEEDWLAYCEDLTIKGRSGTDFTPVFRYVEKLRAQKALTDLKCLLYFTDGEGVYPRRKPDYETAFVFMGDEPVGEKVPAWAIRLRSDRLGKGEGA